ncbi:uncharacterized protein BDV17DRAFT_157376 [Aspergillus undulatus]|uniref:uncharacterized protein n=1 Tax=Aspergillus undulatus TaxID=1810928 RepID=UPI003CCD98ED
MKIFTLRGHGRKKAPRQIQGHYSHGRGRGWRCACVCRMGRMEIDGGKLHVRTRLFVSDSPSCPKPTTESDWCIGGKT